ncbi:sarcosine oxidase subunit gamma family protein [Cereibacter sp. SYSU M97828]|nr:sarcosine oxidase subunit gamma family protein [Cereibacter flavus]
MSEMLFEGFAKVADAGPVGMVTLRAKPGAALDAALGTVPGHRQIAGNVAWMSPDEYLIFVPYADVAAKITELDTALAGAHHLAVDVSDSRAVFDITGPKAADVLSKLMPVDFRTLREGEIRRSRAGQVAAAVWRHEGGYRLFCFRSVARYVFGLLSHSAQPGSEI